MDAGYTYQLSVLQAEISVAQMLAFHCPGWCSSSSCPRQPRQRPPGQAHLDLRAAHPHRPPPHPDAAGTGWSAPAWYQASTSSTRRLVAGGEGRVGIDARHSW